MSNEGGNLLYRKPKIINRPERVKKGLVEDDPHPFVKPKNLKIIFSIKFTNRENVDDIFNIPLLKNIP